MAPIRWSFDRFVPIEPGRVFAWMTDFRPDDHSRPAFRRGAGATTKETAKANREVVSRDGDVVVLRDTWKGRTWEMTVTIDPAERALVGEAGGGYRTRWWVEDNPGGARVRVEGEFAPRGLLKLLAPLFAKGMLRDMEQDFRGHMADIVHELNPESIPAGGGIDARVT